MRPERSVLWSEHVSTIRRLRPHGQKGCPRRKVYSWPRKGIHWVKWYGFFLTVRVLPFRGLEVLVVQRGSLDSSPIWRAASLEEDE